MEKLKDQLFSPQVIQDIGEQLYSVYPSLNRKKFSSDCLDEWETLELKQRLDRLVDVCDEHLPNRYKDALSVLYGYSEILTENKFAYMFMPGYVAKKGLHNNSISLQALKDFTRHSTSELAIRYFLQNDLKDTLSEMHKWVDDEDFHIRRLASEGCRPRLPWAKKVSPLIDTPGLTSNILTALNDDPDKYVQKSVANHLNDISKDYPVQVMRLVKSWPNDNLQTQWIIKHGLRTLIKNGNKDALKYFGAGNVVKLEPVKLQLKRKKLTLGDELEFSFALETTSKKVQHLIIDYKIHYMKKSGERKPKVFKLKVLDLEKSEKIIVTKKQVLKDFSTRKHYSGKHEVEIMINGKVVANGEFHLKTLE